MYDIKIMNAKTRNSSKLVSIGIIGNKIADIGDSLPVDAKEIIDAKGRITGSSFPTGWCVKRAGNKRFGRRSTKYGNRCCGRHSMD